MSPPLTPPTDPSVPRLRPWSRSHRLFPLEYSLGAYLPVDRFSDAVVATGYSGPWSLEVFNDSLNEEGKLVPQQHAHRGMKGLHLAASQAYERAQLKNCACVSYFCLTRACAGKGKGLTMAGISSQESDPRPACILGCT